MGAMIAAYLLSAVYLILVLRREDALRLMKRIAAVQDPDAAQRFDSSGPRTFLRLFSWAGLALSLTFAVVATVAVIAR